MPLKLSLKPAEKFVLNGAVLQNGDRRTTLVVQNRASVLREKDILQEGDADTPAKRIYFPVMMMYIDQDSGSPYYDEFVLRMTEFMNAVRNPQVLKTCVAISRDVMGGQFYKALSGCRDLIDYETEVMGSVSERVSEGR